MSEPSDLDALIARTEQERIALVNTNLRDIRDVDRRRLCVMLRENVTALRRLQAVEAELALFRRLEFGVYRLTAGREGKMCGICYAFDREGHTPNCWLGNALRALGREATP